MDLTAAHGYASGSNRHDTIHHPGANRCPTSFEPTHSTFGRPIIDQGVVQRWISDARVRIEQVRLLVLKTAWLMDTVGNRGAAVEISAIKVAAPAMATWVIDRAIQVHGGGGVTQDFPLAECSLPGNFLLA